jgi:hypothetical protein
LDMDHTLRGDVYRRNREREENLKLESGWCAHCSGANKVVLNWQWKLLEGDWEVGKRSGRYKSIWVVIHMCMESMLGIFLYSYFYLKLAKTLCLSYYCLWLLFNNIGEEGRQVLPGSECVE